MQWQVVLPLHKLAVDHDLWIHPCLLLSSALVELSIHGNISIFSWCGRNGTKNCVAIFASSNGSIHISRKKSTFQYNHNCNIRIPTYNGVNELLKRFLPALGPYIHPFVSVQMNWMSEFWSLFLFAYIHCNWMRKTI